jgi:tripartite-type tricarboxylate transporter receptor subunit TctC
MTRTSLIAGLALAAALAGPVSAQQWPSKNITLVVPLGPGAGMDLIARMYAEKLSASLGKTVVVENRPGASLSLGATAVATGEPDGHTLGIATTTVMVVNPVLMKQLRYNPRTDFAPIAIYVKSPFVFISSPSLGVKTVHDFIALAKKRQADNNPLSYASLGAGASQHLSMEYLKQLYKVDILHVPYKVTTQAVGDIASGHVSAGFSEIGAALGLIRDDKLNALAVSSATELPALPGVKPFAEAGNAPGFELVSWHILLAHAKTPRPIVERLHNEMKTIMADPVLTKRIADMGLLPHTTPDFEGMNKYIASEADKWGKVVRDLGLEGSQ